MGIGIVVPPYRLQMPKNQGHYGDIELDKKSTGLIAVNRERPYGGREANIIHMRMSRREFFEAMRGKPGNLPKGFVRWNAMNSSAGYTYNQVVEYMQKGSPNQYEAVKQRKSLYVNNLSPHMKKKGKPHHSRGKVIGSRLRKGHPKPFRLAKPRPAPGILTISFENAIGGGSEEAFIQRGAALLALEEAAAVRGIPIRFIGTFRNYGSVHGPYTAAKALGTYNYNNIGSSAAQKYEQHIKDRIANGETRLKDIRDANPTGTDVRVVLKQPGERVLEGAIAFSLSTTAMCRIVEYSTISLAALHGGMISENVGGQRQDSLSYLPGERPSDLHVQPWIYERPDEEVIQEVEHWIEALKILDQL